MPLSMIVFNAIFLNFFKGKIMLCYLVYGIQIYHSSKEYIFQDLLLRNSCYFLITTLSKFYRSIYLIILFGIFSALLYTHISFSFYSKMRFKFPSDIICRFCWGLKEQMSTHCDLSPSSVKQ